MTKTVKSYITIKHNKYYIILNWYDDYGKRTQKWVSTELQATPENEANALMLSEIIRQEYDKKIFVYHGNILFEDYMKWWLNDRKMTWAETTFHTYEQIVYSVIAPYFEGKNIKLYDLRPLDIQRFYNYKQSADNINPNTISLYHSNIHKALKYAVKMEFIERNPADFVELPKKTKPRHDFYNSEELKTLLDGVKGHAIEPAVMLGAWFGLRREEACGLKWQYVDFEKKLLHIKGVLTYKGKLRYEERTKTEKSTRTLQMPDACVEYLKRLKENQDRRKMQRGYNKKWVDFVCVHDNGEIIRPDYVTRHLPIVCEQCKLRRITFHQLRHTNISLLVSGGEDVKKIQEWAGHSTYKTTMDVYGHLLPNNQMTLVNTLNAILC